MRSPAAAFGLPPDKLTTNRKKDANGPLSTTAVRLRQELVGLILSGEIAAGRRLDQRQLAKRLKTTTAPLREAFSALESEGMLVRQQGLGVFCRIYTVLEVEEMVEIRGVLEALAARRATAHISDANIADLRRIAAQLAKAIPPGGDQEFMDAHVDFHRRIVQISRSLRLQELLEFHRLIDVILTNIVPGVWASEPHDHMEVVEALAARNPESAEQAMRNHIAPTYHKRFASLRVRFGEGLILPATMHGR
jgi:DNA-binding GntR family transcriptional regulator